MKSATATVMYAVVSESNSLKDGVCVKFAEWKVSHRPKAYNLNEVSFHILKPMDTLWMWVHEMIEFTIVNVLGNLGYPTKWTIACFVFGEEKKYSLAHILTSLCTFTSAPYQERLSPEAFAEALSFNEG